jgi:Raf kinase inhibitor-like YbhB/YbcL family protein
MAFTLTSSNFEDGASIPVRFTCDGANRAPALAWSDVPAGTRSFALVVEDPDAPTPEPFCHWLVWGLAPQQGQLLEGEAPPRVGKNAFGNSEWLLPDPPTGQAAHDYIFQLFALDMPLTLMPGATRGDLIGAMEGHVLAAAVLTGTYARSEDDLDWDEGDGE